LSAVVVGTFPV